MHVTKCKNVPKNVISQLESIFLQINYYFKTYTIPEHYMVYLLKYETLIYFQKNKIHKKDKL